MKKILKPLFCAAAIVSLAGCNKFDEANATPETSNGSLIKVYANVAENDGTRANINVGESVFTAEWEAGDALGILPVKTGGTAPATAAKFDYNTASAAFEGSLNDFVAGGGNYYAFFPHAQVTGTTANLPFGNLRTQTGNDFNSAYDALVATPQAYGAADEAGKVDGNPVAFTLHRLTSILDFSIATQADKVKYLLLTPAGKPKSFRPRASISPSRTEVPKRLPPSAQPTSRTSSHCNTRPMGRAPTRSKPSSTSRPTSTPR